MRAIDLKNSARLKILRFLVCAGLLAGILFSFELWFAIARSFPRAPMVFDLPDGIVAPIERTLCVVLIGALVFGVFAPRRSQIFLIPAALASLAALVFFDQMRLHPWVYQYFLLLSIFALGNRETAGESISNQTLALAQIIIAALYFWSGIQKLNFTFCVEVLPFLLAPLANFFPKIELPFFVIGVCAAIFEAAIGVGLLVRRIRNAAVCAALSMHAVILLLLIARNYNSIVWIWNAALAAIVLAAFWRTDSVVESLFEKTGGWRIATAKCVAAMCVLLPVLSFFDLSDAYLSGALYSGNTETAVVKIDDEVFDKLPIKAQQSVFRTKNGDQAMLPLFEWAIHELNVPVYPEKRVFNQVGRAICRLASEKNAIELIVKERPAILGGSHKVSRINCAQIER